jgi:hypothetical protein
MKKYNVRLASVVLFFATGAAIGMERPLNPNIEVYVVNKAVGFGGKQYTVTIKAEPDLMSTQMGLEPFEKKKVPFGSPIYVNQLSQIADIKTSGDYATGWISNENALREIKQQANKMNANADVYVHVVSNGSTGYYINGWHWAEEAQAAPSIITSFDDLPEQLQMIIKGAWGQDYAKKVMDICGADYTKIQKLGWVNLCQNLTKTLDPLFGKTSKKIKSMNSFEIKTTEDEIKETINRLHKTFLKWRSEGKL